MPSSALGEAPVDAVQTRSRCLTPFFCLFLFWLAHLEGPYLPACLPPPSSSSLLLLEPSPRPPSSGLSCLARLICAPWSLLLSCVGVRGRAVSFVHTSMTARIVDLRSTESRSGCLSVVFVLVCLVYLFICFCFCFSSLSVWTCTWVRVLPGERQLHVAGSG